MACNPKESLVRRKWRTYSGHPRPLVLDESVTMWEVNDGVIDSLMAAIHACIQARVERDERARVMEERRRIRSEKELNWLAHGAKLAHQRN